MKITKQHTTFEQVTSETIIVGVQKNSAPEVFEKFDTAFGPQFSNWVKTGEISTAKKKVTKLPVQAANEQVKRIIFVGLGDKNSMTEQELREAFGLVGKQLKALKQPGAAIWIDSFVQEELDALDVAHLAAEGTTLGYYTIANYKTSSNEVETYYEQVELITESDIDEVAASFEVGSIYGNAVNNARMLVNLPPNMLTATDLANYAAELAEKYDFEVEILGKAELEELGMGGILSVNKGSHEEPRLITLKYQATDNWEEVIGLVGKGVTYDTGGYSLKPRDAMVGMKGDMGGAAAVLGAMEIIGETRPNKNVVAVIGSTDNMVSGTAFKPDDVITTYSGKTVEVLNTDAEGRLVLADAVTYAKQQGASQLVDVATLTGGVITALGFDKTGTLTNNDAFYAKFTEAAEEAGEFVWQLPLTESDKKRIRKSDMADLNNSPGRDGHMIFGGGFVGEFAEETPWIHLDIAGTSDAQAANDLGPKGGTGAMVRTLATFVEILGENE